VAMSAPVKTPNCHRLGCLRRFAQSNPPTMLPTTPTTINPRNHTSKASIVTNSRINSACILIHQLEFALQTLNLPSAICQHFVGAFGEARNLNLQGIGDTRKVRSYDTFLRLLRT